MTLTSSLGGDLRSLRLDWLYVSVYSEVLVKGSWITNALRFVCCVWVYAKLAFKEMYDVCDLLNYHDFSHWFMRVKGEEAIAWEKGLIFPLVQYVVSLVLVTF